MINFLAHFTAVEAPAGLLLFLAGFVAGIVAPKLLQRLRPR